MTDQVAVETSIPTPPDFPVEWPDPSDARLFWSQDRMHWPEPVGWLAETFEFGSMSGGIEQAASEFSLPIRIRIRTFNRYPYMSIGPRSEDPEVMAELGRGAEAALGPRIMGLQRTWEDEALPELKADVAVLRGFDYASTSDADLAVHLGWVTERRIRQLALHFLLVLPQHAALGLFGQVYSELLHPDDETEPYQLLQGFLNKTVEGGHALWRLSREAARFPAVREAIALGEPSAVFARLDQSPEGREFAARLRAYLDEFGWRGDSINMDDRTWATYPRTPLSTLRTYLTQPDEDSPEASHAALVEGRAAALARARERLASAPEEARARFEAVLQVAQFATVLHEDHNYYIDQMLQHLSRRAFVAAGTHLVARGQLADAEDVIYLTVDEIRGSLVDLRRRDLHALVEGRRHELEHWRTVTPPQVIGTPPPPQAPAGEPSPLEAGLAGFVGLPPKASRHSREIRGNAGSRGRVTGSARVALTLEAADGLQPGEILVCPTTAPAWTPLFATAAAVVTDAGGILSHCAVVAREFGIPAVVGTLVGTATIRTGQRMTVDGSTGTVTLELENMDHAVSIRRLYDLINAGDIDGFGRQVADDFVEHEEAPGIPPTKAGVTQYFKLLTAAFPDLRMEVEDVIASGDKAVARVRVTGTHKGPFMGMPATGKPVAVNLIDITRFGDDGRAREHWGVIDQLALMQQLGAIPAVPPS